MVARCFGRPPSARARLASLSLREAGKRGGKGQPPNSSVSASPPLFSLPALAASRLSLSPLGYYRPVSREDVIISVRLLRDEFLRLRVARPDVFLEGVKRRATNAVTCSTCARVTIFESSRAKVKKEKTTRDSSYYKPGNPIILLARAKEIDREREWKSVVSDARYCRRGGRESETKLAGRGDGGCSFENGKRFIFRQLWRFRAAPEWLMKIKGAARHRS